MSDPARIAELERLLHRMTSLRDACLRIAESALAEKDREIAELRSKIDQVRAAIGEP